MGLPSLATAALIGMGMAATRGRHLRHLRRRPLSTEGKAERRPRHPRQDQGRELDSLFDETGVPLHPELMLELDAIKRDRIGGLMLTRDWGDRRPWPTWPTPDTRPHAHEPQGEGDHPRRWPA